MLKVQLKRIIFVCRSYLTAICGEN